MAWLTAARRLSFASLQEETAFWVEGRPEEGGRSVLMCQHLHGQSAPRDLTPAPFSVRSRVHEYGGQAYACAGDRVWFVDDVSQSVYEIRADGGVRRVAEATSYRLADLSFDPHRERLLAVGERHEVGHHEPLNAVVAIDLATGGITALCEGHDFFAAPRLDPSGRWLAYLTWDHPDMPWDGAALWLAAVQPDGAVAPPTHVAGDSHASAFGPCWSANGTLAFAWERDGHWNLFSCRPGQPAQRLGPPLAAECALPLWQLGMSTFGWLSDEAVMVAFVQEGLWRLGVVDVRSDRLEVVNGAWPSVSHLHANAHGAIAIAARPDLPAAVVHFSKSGASQILRASLELSTELAACVSLPQNITFATADQQEAHAFYYPPAHALYAPLPHEKPPLLVLAHGGPTAATTPAWNAAVQYWTSRGFGVVDVNYRGSTGYGRSFRSLLDGQWGVTDVQDCVFAARHLAQIGQVDGSRLAIRGSSAGGFTALSALTYRTFAAGASLYGVADLEALVRDTHKFEARYLDRLIGPYPACADLYRARSPLHAAASISSPVIFFQGLEDKVVPPNQTEAMVEALRARHVPVECHLFEGEQHGFRKAETLRQVYAAEAEFYGRIFGFEPA